MEKKGLDIDGDTPADKKTTKSVQEARRQSIERCIQSLEHYTYCEDKTCSSQSCMKMKKVLHHAKGCKRKNNNDCSICKQLIALCWYHAKSCTRTQCRVPYCHHIKNRLQQQQLQQRLHQRQILRRRIAAMNRSQQPQSSMAQPAMQPVMAQRPAPMPTPPSIPPQKPINPIPIPQSTIPPPNAMVSTSINQNQMDMGNTIRPNIPPGMGSIMQSQPRFANPSNNNFQPNMSANTMMGQNNNVIMNPINNNDWNMMTQQRHNPMGPQNQMNGMGMMSIPSMPQQPNMMGQMPQMQGQMPQNPQIAPQMQQLLHVMRSGSNNPNTLQLMRQNPQLLALIRHQKLKQGNNFMNNMNMNNPQGMQSGTNAMQMSQWQMQQQKQHLMHNRRMLNMNPGGPGFSSQVPNQTANPRMMNRQFSQDMPPPGAGMMTNTNQPSPQMMAAAGRITPNMQNHQMMSPQPNMMSPQQMQPMPTPSPRSNMSPSLRATSPHPAMSPQQIQQQKPSPQQAQQHIAQSPIPNPNQTLTSPMHIQNSPAQPNSHLDPGSAPGSVQQPSSVPPSSNQMHSNEMNLNNIDTSEQSEDQGDMLLNFVEQL